MAAPTFFGKLFGRTTAPARRAPKATLSVARLEDRDVPAAFTFSRGTLTIDMNDIADRTITVAANSGGVVVLDGKTSGSPAAYVDGAPAGRLHAAAVQRVVVRGSAGDDGVNLSAVDTRWFGGLDGKVAVYGGDGRDTIRGTAFDDAIYAGDGDDKAYGMGGDDLVLGEAGNDALWGDGTAGVWARTGGKDRIEGGTGDDKLFGAGGHDVLIGGAGNDKLFGENGSDRMDGGAGDDTLNAGAGDDVLVGGPGKDQFAGGLGYDVAWFDPTDGKPKAGFGGVELHRTGTPPKF